MKFFRLLFTVHMIPVHVLICCSIASAVGVYLQILWDFHGITTTFITLGCMRWLLTTPPHTKLREVSVIAYALLQGAAMGPLIKLAIDSNKIILKSALMAVLAYASFPLGSDSGKTMLLKLKAYFAYRGVFSVGFLIHYCIRFGSLIFDVPGASIFHYELNSGILSFFGFMLVDSKESIVVPISADSDHLMIGFLLFSDILYVFVRIINLMMLLFS